MLAMAESKSTSSDKTEVPADKSGDVLLSLPVVVNAKQDAGTGDERRFVVELGHHPDSDAGVHAFTVSLKVPGDVADTLERAGNYVLQVRRA